MFRNEITTLYLHELFIFCDTDIFEYTYLCKIYHNVVLNLNPFLLKIKYLGLYC